MGERARPVMCNNVLVRRTKSRRPCGRPWRVVALDNDETMGYWGPASIIYMLWIQRLGRTPSVTSFVDDYLRHGGARPGVSKLLQDLSELLSQGMIDEVVMFTAASDAEGWVSFLKDCLEQYAGTPGLFGRVLSRQANSPLAADGRMLKDLSLVSSEPRHVVLLDDKPEYAWKGFVIGVPEYRALVSTKRLEESFEIEMDCPSLSLKIRRAIQRDQELHPVVETAHSEEWAEAAMTAIRNMFYENMEIVEDLHQVPLDFRQHKR